MQQQYDHKKIEAEVQSLWQQQRSFEAKADTAKEK